MMQRGLKKEPSFLVLMRSSVILGWSISETLAVAVAAAAAARHTEEEYDLRVKTEKKCIVSMLNPWMRV